MADNRKINHGIRLDDGTVITDVDELAKAKLPAERMAQLEEAGSIEGFSKKSAKSEDGGSTKKPKK